MPSVRQLLLQGGLGNQAALAVSGGGGGGGGGAFFNEDNAALYTKLLDLRTTLQAANNSTEARLLVQDSDSSWWVGSPPWVQLITDANGDGSNIRALRFSLDHLDVDAGHAPFEFNGWSTSGVTDYVVKFKIRIAVAMDYDTGAANPGAKLFLCGITPTTPTNNRRYCRIQGSTGGGASNNTASSDIQSDDRGGDISGDLAYNWIATANRGVWKQVECRMKSSASNTIGAGGGTIQFYIDGVNVLNNTNADTGTGALQFVQFFSSFNNLLADCTIDLRDLVIFQIK